MDKRTLRGGGKVWKTYTHTPQRLHLIATTSAAAATCVPVCLLAGVVVVFPGGGASAAAAIFPSFVGVALFYLG